MKNNKSPRSFYINVPIYDLILIVSVNESIYEFKDYIKQFTEESELRNSIVSYVEDEDLFNDAERLGSAFKVPNYSVFCIIINKHTNPNYLMNTLSHEVLHTVFAMMKHLGIKYSDKSEESFTYLNGYIMEEIYKQLPNE